MPQTLSETVLVVDDDPDVRTFVCRALRAAGHRAIGATDATAALAAATSEEFTVLVTDVVIPYGTGLSLADAIARIHPDVRVIVMSGYSDGTLAGHLPSRYCFLQKPFSAELLIATVAQAGPSH